MVWIGEAPGRAEDLAGRPFVGASGRRLDRAIADLGLGPEEFGIVNLVKCRPPANRLPRASVVACRPYLERQLHLLDPRFVITLGRHALSELVPGAGPITRVAGCELVWNGRPLVPLLHPAAILHNPVLAPRWADDLRRLGRVLDRVLRQTL